MASLKTVYVCQECGARSPKWLGKCLTCNGWNTFVEEVVEKKKADARRVTSLSGNQPLTRGNHYRRDGANQGGHY